MCYGYQSWSEESLMQVYDDDDLHGGQRSSEVKCGNYVIWLPNLEETLVQVYDDDDDLHEGQRSSEVKCGKRCTLVTKLGQKESLMQVYDGDDLHEGQRSSEVKCGKFCTMVTKLGQQNR